MATIYQSLQPVASRVLARSVHDHWRLFLAEAAILILLGFAAVVVPPLAGLAAAVVLGWVFLIAGIAGLASTLGARHAPGFVWSLLSATAAVVAGGLLLWNPFQGLVTLTYVLTAFFIIDGVLLIVLGLAHREELSGRWEWMLANGALDLLLAAIIISGLPGSLIWALGLLVGVDMIFSGGVLILMALDARRPEPT